MRTDHPRVCGEHKPTFFDDMAGQGSSPRLRGALTVRVHVLGDLGIIPAFAGSTSDRSGVFGATGDHPRVCGEHLACCGKMYAQMGSSPRLRGAHQRQNAPAQRSRIIPAFAGSTGTEVRKGDSNEDHPRVCGEHCINKYLHKGHQGSSPRLRGALRIEQAVDIILGIIPAFAGSTTVQEPSLPMDRDHPRVCGEHRMRLCPYLVPMGSSPRLRGARGWTNTRYSTRRIIPAFAGSTSGSLSATTCAGDHPRVCGEHYAIFGDSDSESGSSPRLRGAR